MDGTLSGGEMKRLEIATVLAKPHKVSIFLMNRRLVLIYGLFHADQTV